MRRAAYPVALLATLIAAPAFAADCAGEVQAAFEKQRTQPAFRVNAKQPSPRGEVSSQTDFQQPDRMYSKVEVPGEPGALETIAIGRWAWASHGRGFQELQPQFAQSVTFDVTAKLTTPAKVTGTYNCLGTVKRDSRDLVGYRNDPKPADDKPVSPDNPLIVRTVYVDPANGLPVLETLSESKADAAALVSVAYTYPSDIKIEAPDAIPAGRTR
jgi:hypothetical protein